MSNVHAALAVGFDDSFDQITQLLALLFPAMQSRTNL
jgi:hypothetical protein